MGKIIDKKTMKKGLLTGRFEIMGIVFYDGFNYLILNDYLEQQTIHCKVCD